jgi:hypothetical protein
MTKQHKATPGQWAVLEETGTSCMSACLLDLRARIDALEAAQQKVRSAHESPLVERVADAIAAQATSAGIVNDRPARAAILEVAAWMIENGCGYNAARWLEREANQ